MSEKFQTCPGCNSLILSDTAVCPECGHKFRSDAAMPEPAALERGATVHQKCPKCGDEVPAGLVRCWTCNAFMREDVAERYKSLVDNPQKIIFSDVPPGERTETIPPRASQGGYARILDAEEDEFTLQGEESGPDDFELNTGSPEAAPASQQPAAETPASEAAAPQEQSADEAGPEDAGETATTAAAETAATDGADASASPGDVSDDDLLNIALTQEKEAGVRKRKRQAAIQRKRILVPCPSCGVWLRVREEQAGRSVRCRSCQSAVPIPAIKKKEKKATEEKEPEIVLDWIEDIHVHLIVPTDITLKPGSLQDNYQVADVTFTEDGLQLTILGGPPKKKSLFSRGDAVDLPTKRNENRAQIKSSGKFSDLPHGESHTVSIDAMKSIRLVQPVRQAHESMFAGVPVFGEGRIVIYLPVQLPDGQQLYCSVPLTLWRQLDSQLQNAGVNLPAKDNGVPQKEIHVSPQCHYTQAKVESIRDVVYYENDPAYELELSGYRCSSCGVAVSEVARAKNKLGGAAGKTIAKAKCPSCSSKFGSEPLYRISRAPEMPEEDDEPGTTEAAAGAANSSDSGSADADQAESSGARTDSTGASDG